MQWIDKVRFNDLKDGLTHTLLVGEKHITSGRIGYPVDDVSIYNGRHLGSSGRIGGPGVPLARDPNFVDPRFFNFGSWHAGVCNFVFADGRVNGLNNLMSSEVLGHLCHRYDGKGTFEE